MNNAMKMVVAPIAEASLEDWESVVNINLRAAFMTIHHLLPTMVERHLGVVVNMIAYEGSPLIPASISSLTVPATSSIGTSGSTRCW